MSQTRSKNEFTDERIELIEDLHPPHDQEHESIPSQEPTPALQEKRPNQMEFVFPKIVDVFAEISSNNYLPMFKFLKKAQQDPKIDVFALNSSGFNLFHLLISSSNFQFTKIVLDNFPEFIRKKTKYNQSNLMIALNQKNFDIITLILEREEIALDFTDDTGFDVFMYLVRNNSIVLFFYFLKRYLEQLYSQATLENAEKHSNENSSREKSEELHENDPMRVKSGYRKPVSEIFAQSIFSLKNKDKQGCNMLHWAAFRDAEFLVKLCLRMGCDFGRKDFKGHLPIEKATENNAVRVVHFLNTYSKYPFHTNYFLFNKFGPVEFDFLPSSYAKIDADYESEILKEDFAFKKLNQFRFSVKSCLYFYAKNNLKFRFGILLYIIWIFVSSAAFFAQMNFEAVILKALFFSLAFCCFILNVWFYRFDN